MAGRNRGGIETLPVVFDEQHQRPILVGVKANDGMRCLGVLDHVVERLLSTPIQMFLNGIVDRDAVSGSLHLDRKPLPGTHGRSMLAESGGQSLFLQSTWAELEDQGPHLGER